MKTITIEELSSRIGELVQSVPGESVLLTKDGKPFALVRDASQYDEEDLGYINDPKFWKMISERMKQPTISLDEAFKRLEERERREGLRK